MGRLRVIIPWDIGLDIFILGGRELGVQVYDTPLLNGST